MTSSAPRFALLFAAQFAAVGVMMPFVPPLLAARGLTATEVGTVLAAAATVRLFSGPLGGRLSDALGGARMVMAAGSAIAAIAALFYGIAAGFLALLLVQVVLAGALAPAVPLADGAALRAARAEGWEYGPVRAAGSLAFIVTAGSAGIIAERAGMDAVPWLIAGTLAASALAAIALPPAEAATRRATGGFAALLATPGFRRLLICSALIQGSHAAYYAFGSIHWTASGLSAGVTGFLWAWAVVAEVALFAWARPIAARVGTPGLALIAAGAGLLRWAITATTIALPMLVLAQALHALTFGAMHLAAMRLLPALAPQGTAGTAQTLHSAAIGAVMMFATLACGPAYGIFGAAIFWGMGAMCLAAMPLALSLSRAQD